MRELLTTAELAKILGVSEVRLRQYRADGVGPDYMRIGRSIRYQPEVVEAWLATKKVDEDEA